jgi:hypothetical protein
MKAEQRDFTIVGRAADNTLVCRPKSGGIDYNCGKTAEEFGLDDLTDDEKRAIGLMRPKEAPRWGDTFVMKTQVNLSLEWLVARFHPDNNDTVLVVPIDDAPFIGITDLALASRPGETPRAVRIGEAVWVDTTYLIENGRRTGTLSPEALAHVSRVMADLASGKFEGIETPTDNDPEYRHLLEDVRRAANEVAAARRPRSDQEIIEILRNALKPKGTAPVVRLDLDNKYYKADFVQECIDEMEQLAKRSFVGDEPTALERLAAHVLMDSAGIESPSSKAGSPRPTDE